MNSETTLRPERPGDEAGIRRVNVDAFPTPAEADLVDRLRQTCETRISLVAVDGDQIVGHLLLTPAIAETRDGTPVEGMGLAPMAVLASHQRHGIGSRLVRRGIAACRDAGVPFIVVLGHPEYYPRFGFERASRFGVTCEYPGVPDDVFRLLPLDEAVAGTLAGVVRYREEFADV